MERNIDFKLQARSERVVIRIKFNDDFQFCDVGLTNLTKKSFLRDGEDNNYHSSMFIIFFI